MRDSVTNGILYDWLKKKARNYPVQRTRIEIDVDLEAVGKAHPFDGQIALDDLQFLGQRNLAGRVSLQACPEDVVEVGQNVEGILCTIQLHQSCYRVQGVKEKVGFKLHLEGTQMGARKLPLQLE